MQYILTIEGYSHFPLPFVLKTTQASFLTTIVVFELGNQCGWNVYGREDFMLYKVAQSCATTIIINLPLSCIELLKAV